MTIANTYLYDQVGRKLKTWEQLTNLNNTPTTKTLVSKIDYNEIGQVLNKHLQSTDSVTFLQTIAYTYNERGWLLSSSAPLFAMTLYYNQSSGNKAYNGNIMYQYWGTSSGMTHLYNYSYDKLNRLLYGVMELTPSGTILNAEQGLSYDQMGNITQLVRTSTGTTQIDNLAYTYTSGGNPTNQLQSVVDNSGSNSGLVAGTTNYTYDGNGNMLTDTNSVNMGQNKTVTYNLLNLPQLVKVHTGTVTYTYDALGNKLRKVSDLSGVTHTTDYISGIEYDGATTDTLNFIQTEEGKAAKFGSIYDYVYYLGDNLGNTRITFGTRTGSTVTYQSDDYYPFGYEINNSLTGTKNEYLYNKKELQEETQEYDYGARMYDPLAVHWNTIDPLAELSRRWSTYTYVEDNPIRYVDPDGMYYADSVAKSSIAADEARQNQDAAERAQQGDQYSQGPGMGSYTGDQYTTKQDEGLKKPYNGARGKIKAKKQTKGELEQLWDRIDSFMKQAGYKWNRQKGGYVISMEGGTAPQPYAPFAKVSNKDRLNLTDIFTALDALGAADRKGVLNIIYDIRSNKDALENERKSEEPQPATETKFPYAKYVNSPNGDTITREHLQDPVWIDSYEKSHKSLPRPGGWGPSQIYTPVKDK